MSRENRDLQDLLERLGREVSPPSEHDLRTMARTASSRSRPLPSPVASRRWPLQARLTGVLVVALVVAIALGVGLGALIAPSSTAAPGPIGTGFLPGPGWTVLQTGSDATPEQQALTVATNVPLHPEDSARGIRASSGLPYQTLLRLPQRGVVIVGLFTARGPFTWQDEIYPRRALPLRFRNAARSNYFSVPVRPNRPLGQYQLRATVNDHYVDLYFYFGGSTPSVALVATAQKQLDRLIVGSLKAGDPRATLVGSAPLVTAGSGGSAASRIVDRTFVCKPVTYGGVGDIDIKAGPHEPPDRFGFATAAHLIVRTGTTLPAGDLVFVRAQPQERTGGWAPPFPGPAGVYAHAQRCKSTRTKVEPSAAGLAGPPFRFESDLTCSIRGSVLVRVRARLAAAADWRRANEPFLIGARGGVEEASLAVRGARSGAPLAYMTVDRTGTRLWASPRCS